MDSASASGAERAGSNPAEGTILQVKSESSFFLCDKTVTYRNIRRRPACAILKRGRMLSREPVSEAKGRQSDLAWWSAWLAFGWKGKEALLKRASARFGEVVHLSATR